MNNKYIISFQTQYLSYIKFDQVLEIMINMYLFEYLSLRKVLLDYYLNKKYFFFSWNLFEINLLENCNVLIAKRRSPLAVWMISFIQSYDGGVNFYLNNKRKWELIMKFAYTHTNNDAWWITDTRAFFIKVGAIVLKLDRRN
jgi:hypothetical protein